MDGHGTGGSAGAFELLDVGTTVRNQHSAQAGNWAVLVNRGLATEERRYSPLPSSARRFVGATGLLSAALPVLEESVVDGSSPVAKLCELPCCLAEAVRAVKAALTGSTWIRWGARG